MVLKDAVDIVTATSTISIGNFVLFPGLWSWVAISGVALLASIGILAFMYVWAALFKNPNLSGYVRQELLECFITAFWIVLIFGLVSSMNGLTLAGFVPTSLLPDDIKSTTNIYEATQLFYEKVDSDMEGWLNLNYIMNMYVDTTASVTPYARPLGVGLVASPLTGIASPLKQILYNMSTALTLALIINHAQLVVYLFSLSAFLNYYLPVGIFFRSFTPTRRLGGALIALVLSFLFVFPALATLDYVIFYYRAGGPLVSVGSLLESYFGDLASGGFQASFAEFMETLNGGGMSVMGLITGAFGGLGDLFQAFVGKVFLVLFFTPMTIVSFAFVIGFIIPAINILIFTSVAKSLSRALGEEVEISSLTRMI